MTPFLVPTASEPEGDHANGSDDPPNKPASEFAGARATPAGSRPSVCQDPEAYSTTPTLGP